MILQFKDILPNPYRDLKRNSLNEETIEALRVSVRKTGFWNNVEVRKNKEGKYELAYGHHRLEAAKREGLTEADFIVRNLTESDMVVRKHKEDRSRKFFDGLTMLESVRAVVKLLAAGDIPPFEMNDKTKKSSIRYAPSFIAGKDDQGSPLMRYTAFAIADFLDETESGGGVKQANVAVRTALDALALIEQQELSEASLKNVPLDNPDPSKPGLLQKVKLKVQQREVRLDVTKAHKALASADENRRQQEKEETARRDELKRRENEAKREGDDKEAKRVIVERKRIAEETEARLVHFKAARAVLDAKVKETEERAEAAKKNDKDLPTRYAVKTMLFKLSTIVSERNSFREEVKSLSKDKAVTTNEREIIRQAMIDAGDWYIEESNKFLPTRRAK
jgi:ParB/RepB/Spo0J family partition protein